MTCSAMTVSNSGSGETSTVSSSPHRAAATASATPLQPIVTKKKRNLPGMPDPDAEVISLSPRTLMATNRFVCEICNKGFQRDQNLQLHRRGHNLPWKLRQRNSKEVKKRVYVCPETSCIHHDPSRALGDLTGIKKHFCRKHGEKKWKCDKCSKKYAVQSDWKAHCKTCGTREYRCDCGTLFSRRDSFITHRAFCDALAEESAKVAVVPSNAVVNSGTSDEDPMVLVPSPRQQTLPPPISPPPAVVSVASLPVIEQQQKELESTNTTTVLHHIPPPQPPMSLANGTISSTRNTASASSACTTTNTSLFASLFSSAAPSPTSTFSELIGAMSDSDRDGFAPQPPLEPISLCLSATVPVNIFSSSTGPHDRRTSYGPPPPPSPHMSATALLQKAAQMGAAATNTSLLRGFGFSTSTTNTPSNSSMNNHLYPCQDERYDGNYEWRNDSSPFDLQQSQGLSSGLGLALQYSNGGVGGLPEFSALCGAKPATLDFLGLGMGSAGSGAGLSAMMTSISSGGFEMGSPFGSGSGKSTWDVNGMERKPSSPARL